MSNYLTKKQVEILIKLLSLEKYSTAAETLGVTASRVKAIEEHALRYIRLAYSKSSRQGKRFDGKTVRCHMAERSNLTSKELSDIFDSYITEGLASGDQPYRERIKRKDENSTAAELLELKINPFIFE